MSEIPLKKSVGIKTRFLQGKMIDYTAQPDALGRKRGYVYVNFTKFFMVKDVETGEFYEESLDNQNWGSPWSVSAEEGAELFEEYVLELIARGYITKIKIDEMVFVNAGLWGEEPDEITRETPLELDEIRFMSADEILDYTRDTPFR